MDLTAVVVVLVVAAVLLVVLQMGARALVLRTGAVPETVAQAERVELINAIKEAATEQQMHVTLRGFWKRRGWNRRQKYYLLRPLIERRVLRLPASSGGNGQALEAIGTAMPILKKLQGPIAQADTRLSTEENREVRQARTDAFEAQRRFHALAARRVGPSLEIVPRQKRQT